MSLPRNDEKTKNSKVTEYEASVQRISFTEQHKPVEIGGDNGPEPTRYGDWEKNGRCFDF